MRQSVNYCDFWPILGSAVCYMQQVSKRNRHAFYQGAHLWTSFRLQGLQRATAAAPPNATKRQTYGSLPTFSMGNIVFHGFVHFHVCRAAQVALVNMLRPVQQLKFTLH